MRYLKHFSRALCLGGSLWMATGVANAVPQTLPACLEEGKQLYSQQNYPQAVNRVLCRVRFFLGAILFLLSVES